MQGKNEKVLSTTPLPRCAVLSPQGGQLTTRGLANFIGTPSSPLWGTSPARGEVNGGFTLIELLVVVLIIGILAAVAVPQYKIAVEKARLTEAIVSLQSIQKAQQRHFLENGVYTTKFDGLDISLPGTLTAGNTQVNLPSDIILALASSYGYAINKSKTNILAFYYSPERKSRCYAKQNDSIANSVCKSLGGTFSMSDSCLIGQCDIYYL